MLLATLLALLVAGTGTAFADSATITFTDAGGVSDPAIGVGRTLTVSGNVASPTRLYARVRPAGGAPCAPSADSDTATRNYYGSWSGDDIDGDTVEGNFVLRKTGNWSDSGTFQYCIWLAPSASSPVVPITQIITFRPERGTISATLNPITPSPGQTTAVTITGASEAPARVYATFRPAGAPCAVSYSAETGSGFVSYENANGAFTINDSFSASSPGPHVVCLFLSQSSDDAYPIAVQTIPFNVVAPCIVPAISKGTDLATVQAALAAASCSLGAQSLKPDAKASRGSVLAGAIASGTTLPSGAAVPVVISDGKSCHVPASKAGIRLSQAKSKLRTAGCTVGKVKHARSRRAKGTVVRFNPKGGVTLAPRSTVTITVSRGKR